MGSGRTQTIPGSSWRAAHLAVVAAGCLLLATWTAWNWRNLDLDDAFITLRIARNMIEGRGWVYNPGERVNGATSALHTLLLAAQGALGAPLTLAPVATYALGMAACAFIVCLLFPGRRPFAGVFAALLLLCNSLLPWSYGLETAILLGACALAIWLYRHERHYSLSVVLGLAVLTRPDAALLALALAVDFLIVHRRDWRGHMRKILICPGLAVLVVLPWIIVSWAYFGTPMPNSVTAKAAQASSEIFGTGPVFLAGVRRWMQWAMPAVPHAWIALVGLGAAGLLRALFVPATRPVALWTLIYFGTCMIVDPPMYHWYYAPLLFGLIFGLAVLLDEAWNRCAGASRAVRFALRGAVALAAAAMIVATGPGFAHPVERSGAQYQTLAAWIVANRPAHESVASFEIGNLGFHLGARRVIDLAGIVTPDVADHVAANDLAWAFLHFEPDLVVVHKPLWGHETPMTQTALFKREYRPLVKVEPSPRTPEIYLFERVRPPAGAP